jgi:hypothetical protein
MGFRRHGFSAKQNKRFCFFSGKEEINLGELPPLNEENKGTACNPELLKQTTMDNMHVSKNNTILLRKSSGYGQYGLSGYM